MVLILSKISHSAARRRLPNFGKGIWHRYRYMYMYRTIGIGL